ncbi:MAG: MMPL family transporter [Rhodovarius sp.]|nr:MMPL family transporter [Rhodovarius sp.]
MAVQSEGWVARAVAGLVGGALRRWRLVLVLYGVVTALALQVAVQRFALTSDVAALFPPDLPWRQAEAALEQAFPHRQDLIVAVIDAPHALLADRTAARLAEALSARADLFRRVARPDAGPFFDRNGILYLDLAEVESLTARLIEAQPMLGTLAADPSLRGIAALLQSAMEGVARGEASLDPLAEALAAFAEAAEAALAGRVAEPDWTRLLTGRGAAALERRRFVLIQPRLDFAALAAAGEATAAIRAAAAPLMTEGVRIRLTGQIAMADEEFATLERGAAESVVLSFALTGLLLFLALRSWRLILPLLVLLLCGLAVTAALGLLLLGRFNPLSIAFAVLFIGLGVDFGIQLCVRYRAERRHHAALAPALVAAARAAGPGMTLAALACALSFFSFLPTDYLGLAELGLVSGAGILIAWAMAMTLLPALLVATAPRAEAREVGYPALAPLDSWLIRHARPMLAGAALLALGCLLLLPKLRFDTDPINLRDRQSEAVATYLELTEAAETTPNMLEVVVEDLAAAEALAARLAALPEVGRVLTLASFLPEAQAEKLALIEDARLILAPGFLASPAAPPTDAEAAEALAEAGRMLGGATGEEAAARAARRLGAAFLALAEAEPASRARLAQALLPGLAEMLRRVQAMLEAGPVGLEDLPEALREEWITRDGRARVQITPAVLGHDAAALARFAAAVQAVEPRVTGAPVSTREGSRTVQRAFATAGVIATLIVVGLLLWTLRSVRLALMALLPLILAGLLTAAHAVLVGPTFNLANIIALPLLFGMGVAFDIYFIAAWVRGERQLLASPLARAVAFSALTNAAAFGALAVSPHPGTASMGVLLSLSLGYSLLAVGLLLPPLLQTFAAAPAEETAGSAGCGSAG